jgi:hypothetical protein
MSFNQRRTSRWKWGGVPSCCQMKSSGSSSCSLPPIILMHDVFRPIYLCMYMRMNVLCRTDMRVFYALIFVFNMQLPYI